MPNPFYQIYEGAALLAGAEPVFLNTTAGNRFQPDLDAVPAAIWKRCEVLFLCSPGNPTGAVLSLDYLRHALELAERARLRDRLRRVLRRAVPRRGRAAAFAAAGGAGQRPRFIPALHGVPFAVEALERARTALRLRRRRSGADQALSSVSHLSRLRHAGAHATRQHRRLERRRACRRESRAVSREIRARAADPAPVLDVVEPDGAFYLWPDVQRDDETFTRELVRDAESHHPARQLPRARHARRQPRPAARAHLAGRAGRRMRDRRAAHPNFPGEESK